MARVIGIVSGKGGVGKSTVAINLALALKKLNKKVILIDCNLTTPHLSYSLGIADYNGSLNDVLHGKVGIKSILYNYKGLKYIPASTKLVDLIDLDLDLMKFKRRLSELSNDADFIILDSAPGLGKEALLVMNASKEVIFVTTPFVPMIADVIRCKEILKHLGEKKMYILLNMVTHRSYELKKEAIEDATELPVIGEIPYDKDINLSLAMKSPILEYKPNNLSSLSFMEVASLLAKKSYKTPRKLRWYKLFTSIKSVLAKHIKRYETKDVKEEILSNC